MRSKNQNTGFEKLKKEFKTKAMREYVCKPYCEICFEDFDRLEIKRKCVVDHCHKTGKIRGLLCFNCNLLLGLATDNIKVLYSAINYLTKDRE